mgnify:CR=1 FL=1
MREVLRKGLDNLIYVSVLMLGFLVLIFAQLAFTLLTKSLFWGAVLFWVVFLCILVLSDSQKG